MSSIHSSAEDEDGPFHSNFDTTHGIQMNPHSPHPPRTPRTSTAHSSGHDLSASSPRHISAALDAEPEEERVHDHPAKTRVKGEEVWREIVKSSDGRDKAFVCHVSVPPCPSFQCASCSPETHPIFDETVSAGPRHIPSEAVSTESPWDPREVDITEVE